MALTGKCQKSFILFISGNQLSNTTRILAFTFLIFFLCLYEPVFSQATSNSTNTLTVIAGKQYNVDKAYQALWGSHYRKEWITPVKVPVINLDSVAGGLIPVRLGGGRQTKTLHLENDQGKPFVLRSVDKDLSRILPEIYIGSFVETIVKDQASIYHPYAALTIPPMIKAAGIYHTNPRIVYVPFQQRLGVYNLEIGNTLCLFEERPDGNQEDAPNFGNSKNVLSTEELFENLAKNNHHVVDQQAFVRARLFDMLIGDWGRHEDQWRWASFNEGTRTVYKPIPRDRDQAYTKFDGGMLAIALKIAKLGHLETFDRRTSNIAEFNYSARFLDRKLTNEVTHGQWIDIAKDLQRSITDSVINNAIHQLPPEVFPISGNEIIAKLKSRRDQLVEVADVYYKFLTHTIDITGTAKKELFEIERAENGATTVKIFGINEQKKDSDPFYTRTFFPHETNEIRLYGLDGTDIYKIKGANKNAIKLRLIPGQGSDSIVEEGTGHDLKNVHIYDTEGAGFNTSAKVHISNDTVLNNYRYDAFALNKNGLTIHPGNRLGIGYRIRKSKWGKEPFGIEHSLIGYYTITRNGLALEYRTVIPQLIGKWNFELNARAEFPFVVYFFGVGNNTQRNNDTNRFYRTRIHELNGGIALNRMFDSTHFLELRPFYQTIKIKNDADKYIGKESGIPETDLQQKHFAGAEAQYHFVKTNHKDAPTRGLHFTAAAGYTQNVRTSNRNLFRYASSLSVYLPLLHNLTFAIRAGGATLNGKAEFYQLNRLGGNETLRGYLRERFYGKTTFYNNNELRWLIKTRSYFFNGTIGLLGFVDNGRVWQPGEISNKWHLGYGAGIVLAPFNQLWLNSTVGISSDDIVYHLQVGFFF